jgi:hypothetical protein
MGGVRMANKYTVTVNYAEEEDLVRKAAAYKIMVKIAIDIIKRKRENAS